MNGPLDTVADGDLLGDFPDESSDRTSFLEDLDPDLNILPDTRSAYYLASKFNQLVLNSPNLKNGLSFFHLNIRSVPANMGTLSDYLTTLDFNFSVVGLTETWLSEHNAMTYPLPGYTSVGVYRTDRRGGGAMLLISNKIAFKRRYDLDLTTEHCECVFVELSLTDIHIVNHSAKTVIGCMYRPPRSDFDQFIHALQSILLTVKRERKTCYLLGDFNVHMNKIDSDPHAQQFLDLMYSHLFLPMIEKPTRITPHSSSLIDNIFSNALNDNSICGLLYTDVSDHLPIFALIEPVCATAQFDRGPVYTRRVFSERNKRKFSALLGNESWEEVLSLDETNVCYDKFSEKLSTYFESAFPISTRTSEASSTKKPWITRELIKQIRRKNKLYMAFHKRPSLFNEIRYKSFKRNLRYALRRAEAEYYESAIQANRNNIKKTWEILNNLMGRNTERRAIYEICVRDSKLTQTSEICEAFNEYFTNVGENIAAEIPQSDSDIQSFLSNNYPQSMFFTPVTEGEVIICLSKLKNSSPGPDTLHPQLIKDNYHSLVKPIRHFINLSLHQGIVPDQLKKANVSPIHKGGDTESVNNYRPISVLNSLSKILERMVYNRLIEYLNSHSILSNSQFGFRKKHSCEMALTLATEFIRESLDSGSHVISVFLDLRKAFDVVSHSVLLRKLEHYGVRGTPLEWFRSYLAGRKQSVKINGELSGPKLVTCGVPQGSVLGPLLFLVFINDIQLAFTSQSSRLLLFADDTSFLISDPNLDSLVDGVNSQLSHLSNWFSTNRLSVNCNKTNFMLFSLSRQVRASTFQILLNDQRIERVTSTKFLGILIDDSLSWQPHVAYISKKLSKSIGIIRRVAPLLPKATRVQLYKSLILPYFDYSHIVWGNVGRTALDRLIKLQKRAVRVVCMAPFLAHTGPLLSECHLLPLASLFPYHCAIFTYKSLHEMFPRTFTTQFNLLIESHPAPRTRNQSLALIRIPFFRTSFGQKSLQYQCAKIYNELLYPLQLHDASLYKLKTSLHQLLS